MSRNKIKRTTVVVSSDIDKDSNRNEFRDFLIDELSASTRTESVYEFDFPGNHGYKWKAIMDKIVDVIDNRTDTVYLWDVDKPKDSKTYEFYRSKIGK